MQELLERMLAALAAAGIRAQEALPSKLAPQLKAPMTAVGVAKAAHLPVGLGGYLGWREDAQTGKTAAYGALLEAEVFFKVTSPVFLGGGRCFQEGVRLMDVLLAGIDGADVQGCQMDRCQYDARTDHFFCTVTAKLRARVILERTEDAETAFADFRLEGEIR